MLDRRSLLLSGIAIAISPGLAFAHSVKNFKLDPKYVPQLVEWSGYPVGTVVVDPQNRFLYLVESSTQARRYGVGVGRAGLAFKGKAEVLRKVKWPSWRPTNNMIRRSPQKYARFAKGVPGGLSNPLGARALYLYRNGRDTMYRIHGTNNPSSIGKAVSNGCIRMLNEHVKDLYERVPMGTQVVVI